MYVCEYYSTSFATPCRISFGLCCLPFDSIVHKDLFAYSALSTEPKVFTCDFKQRFIYVKHINFIYLFNRSFDIWNNSIDSFVCTSFATLEMHEKSKLFRSIFKFSQKILEKSNECFPLQIGEVKIGNSTNLKFGSIFLYLNLFSPIKVFWKWFKEISTAVGQCVITKQPKKRFIDVFKILYLFKFCEKSKKLKKILKTCLMLLPILNSDY